jgi:uncharacterized membrane protein YkvA (DUF1232 family)
VTAPYDGCDARRTEAALSLTTWVLLGVAAVVVLYLIVVLTLVVIGRHEDARALGGFIPDCVVVVKRLLRDPRVPRRRKLLLGFVVLYLASPIDLVPDFVPVAGQLDDAIVVALALRVILRSGGDELLREHWPGPERSLDVIRRLMLTPSRAA